MSFNSTPFAVFLFCVFFAYWAMARTSTLRKVFLLVASCLFYMSWDARFLVLILASTVLDFVCGREIHGSASASRRRFWLAASLLGNLGLLGFFKYFNFFAETWIDLLRGLGLSQAAGWEHWNIVLPVGISFYTFQTLSYTIDIYRRELEPVGSLLDFALFVSFFPQLVAGPIVRARDFLPQLAQPARWDAERAGRGLFLILCGLIKKVGLADVIGHELVVPVFDEPAAYAPLEIAVGVWAALFQFYLDFSAYSDIAIGSAALLGFVLPLNFDRPFMAQSISEFWRRWHITMSTWFRDYVFFSLGGTRTHALGRFRNIMIALLLTGLWHGAAWNYVIWGGFHGLLTWIGTLLPKGFGELAPGLAGRVLRRAVIFNLVALSMLFFRNGTDGVGASLAMLARLGDLGPTPAALEPFGLGVLALSALIHFTPKAWVSRSADRWMACPSFAQAAILCLATGVLCVVAYDSSPFIYFQF